MNTLNSLNGWTSNADYLTRRSAQSYMRLNEKLVASSSCGSSCGSSEEKPKPSACGAGDEDPKPKPSACGAGDDKPKPSACGSSCSSEGK